MPRIPHLWAPLGLALISWLPGCVGEDETVVGEPRVLPVPPGEHPTQLALTANRACVLTSSGRVYCHDAERGDAPAYGPARVIMGIDDAVTLSGRELTLCALRTTGDVQCFGENPAGLFRDGTNVASDNAVALTGLPRLKAVSMGAFHACGLTAVQTADRGLVCWGDASDGKAGPVDPTQPPKFFLDLLVYTGAEAMGGGIGPLTAGQAHTCVGLRASEAGPFGVGCFGDPMFGRLGVDDNEVSAHVVETPEPVVQVVLGETHTCVLLEGGTVGCFGFNAKGQIGVVGTDTAKLVMVEGLTNVQQLAAGDDFTCARLLDGTVSCWGDNGNGQFATAESAGGPELVTVPELEDAVELAAAQSHACALRAEGELVCWGNASTSRKAVAPMLLAPPEGLTGPATPGARPPAGVPAEELEAAGRGSSSGVGLPEPVFLTEPVLGGGAALCESTCRHLYEDCERVLTAGETPVSKLDCVLGCQRDGFGTDVRDCLAVSPCDRLDACFDPSGTGN
jgi:hypothetical protein